MEPLLAVRLITPGSTLQIGGLHIHLQGASSEATCRFTDPYAPFLSRETSEPDVILDIDRAPVPLPADHALCFDTGTSWCMVKSSGLVAIYNCAYEAMSPRSAKEVMTNGLVMTPDFSRGTLYVMAPEGEGPLHLENPLRFPLDQLLTIQLLAAGRGMLLHASCVVDEGRGYGFVGSSGRGKSTMASFWDGEATILTDDKLILRPQGDAFWVYGTPWHGILPTFSPEGCPLEALFLLGHGPENHLRHLPPIEAASRLLVASFAPLWDQEGMAWTLQLLDRLTASVPVYELAFRPDAAIVPFIRQAVREYRDGLQPA